MSFNDLTRRQNRQEPRDGLEWELYRTEHSNTPPKDLLVMFAEILAIVAPDLLGGKKLNSELLDSEIESLRKTLNFINKFGISSILTDKQASILSRMNDAKVPDIKAFKGAHLGISELRIANTRHNPRFLFCLCSSGKLIFLIAFKKKSRKTGQTEKETALMRYRDLKKRGECP